MAETQPFDCALICWLFSDRPTDDRLKKILQRAASRWTTEELDRNLAACAEEDDLLSICRSAKRSGAKLPWCHAVLLLRRLGGDVEEDCPRWEECLLAATLRSTAERIYRSMLADGTPVEVVIDAASKVLCCLYVKKQYRGGGTVKASLATCEGWASLLLVVALVESPLCDRLALAQVSIEELASITLEVHRRLPTGRLESASTLQQLVEDVVELIVSSE
ncbi:hypothetical protein FOZ63_001579 [Perkinsus olseni]|uniref:Uncharacterized protein n=1 Tax=Perkinsus olseni TaxID=32597 RepID=A0A7J6R704_PEROL|nr:hypothetical protein FOZ63_001579 [Perkinsus olseni]KAF4716879.1 hypothetical protein FOZ62_001625 [Perkinsus olseni]